MVWFWHGFGDKDDCRRDRGSKGIDVDLHGESNKNKIQTDKRLYAIYSDTVYIK